MACERPPAGRFAPAAVPLRKGDTKPSIFNRDIVPLTKGDSRWSEATGRGSLTHHFLCKASVLSFCDVIPIPIDSQTETMRKRCGLLNWRGGVHFSAKSFQAVHMRGPEKTECKGRFIVVKWFL